MDRAIVPVGALRPQASYPYWCCQMAPTLVAQEPIWSPLDDPLQLLAGQSTTLRPPRCLLSSLEVGEAPTLADVGPLRIGLPRLQGEREVGQHGNLVFAGTFEVLRSASASHGLR